MLILFIRGQEFPLDNPWIKIRYIAVELTPSRISSMKQLAIMLAPLRLQHLAS